MNYGRFDAVAQNEHDMAHGYGIHTKMVVLHVFGNAHKSENLGAGREQGKGWHRIRQSLLLIQLHKWCSLTVAMAAITVNNKYMNLILLLELLYFPAYVRANSFSILL